MIAAAAIAFTQFGRHAIGTLTARVVMGTKPVNLLIIANNARGVRADDPLGLGNAAGQADVILVARFDPTADRIYAITVPRDALFAQPGWNNTVPKIKTLFFMGNQETPPRGPELLKQAVSQLTGLPIDGYLVMNFAGFQAAVDMVGGLTVDVKKRIYDPRHSGADFQPGVQHMDGAQVLAFVRVRQNDAGNDYRVNDFQRMQAEVQVVGLLRAKVLDPRTVAPLDIETIARSVAKTGRLLIVDEAFASYGIGAEIAAQLADRGFDDLDAPIRRLNGIHTPTPYSPPLEAAVVPKVENIVQAIRDLIAE